MDKLSKMLRIAEMKNDVMGQFHNAMYLGDVGEHVKILENAGQLPLAYVTGSSHGLTEVAVRPAAELEQKGIALSLPRGKARSFLMPPAPLLCGGDWPLLRVMRGIFDGGLGTVGRAGDEEEYEATGADWCDEDLDIVDVDGVVQDADIVAEVEDIEANRGNDEEGWWDLEDLKLPPDVDTPRTSINARASVFVAPSPGLPVSQIWIQKSSFAGEHATAGNFDTTMRLLSRQLGIKNFVPLKPLFKDLHMGSHTFLNAFALAPEISTAVEKGWSESASPNVRGPSALVFDFSQMDQKLKSACKATTDGKFPEALWLFLSILHSILLIVLDSRRAVDEVKELIEIAKEYVLGLKIEVKRKETEDNMVQQQELAAYFTNCKLQKIHMRLALMSAMTVCYGGRSFSTAANFTRMLLENNPPEAQAEKARKVLVACGDKKDTKQLNL